MIASCLKLEVCAPGAPEFCQDRDRGILAGANYMVVVCDLTRHEGQQAVQVASNHINAVRVLNKGARALPGVLIGNKTDLEERRKVSSEQLEGFASQQGLAYFETSASDSMTSCQEPFEHIARDYHNKFSDQLKLTASGTLQV